MNSQLVVCNIDLHNNFGSDSTLFFDRLKHLEHMRTMPSDESFTYFITCDFELDRLKQLQLGVKTGKIDFLNSSKRRDNYVFALDINQRIIDWLYFSTSKDLEKQIIA